MTESEAISYVYVYIDPRNYEEFYYGKGKGSRKDAHISMEGDSEKIKRIKAIQKEGLQPTIKVLAKGLTDQEALLVEKTLIWKLGKSLLNDSTGHFADKFRPHDTFHLDLSGFDFKNGLYYVNVGEGIHRCWDDCKDYGFLSAGQDRKWSDPIRTLMPGDIVVAYLKNKGYVGVGRVIQRALKPTEFKAHGIPLKPDDLKIPNIFENSDNEKSEYLVAVDWIQTVQADKAKWKPRSGLFTSQLIKASLQNQKVTREFLESEFGIDLRELLLQDQSSASGEVMDQTVKTITK
ncbi:GIY-YIG nuclease family protein [Algoriphagus sp. NG3]|uniref:GIY-YIG nuclease family protein n=1 Tax=Algoriphagus sp. NG3 TaxID=3097546 RepID=UPI002A834407|nr:GIY-YIG nuclease family protein [Algoriphagus sp. NG3]WPR75219.1 GIY-YIG nuclease family protein [Algoriphagus sp. NG3]